MKVTTLREIFKNKEAYYDQEVTVGGWVRSNRDSKQFGFLTISDGTFFTPLQVVYHDIMANFQEVAKYGVGAAVIVKGKLVATPDAKQAFEVQADEVMLEGASSPDYPLQKKRHTLEYLRTIDHLRPSAWMQGGGLFVPDFGELRLRSLADGAEIIVGKFAFHLRHIAAAVASEPPFSSCIGGWAAWHFSVA